MRRRRGVHGRQQAAQPFQLLGRDPLREAAPDQFVEYLAQVVDLVGLGDRDLAHEHAAVALGAHQSAFLEGAQRLADRAAAGAEAGGQGGLVDALAGGEFAAEDHLLDLGLHGGRQRVRLQELQWRGRVHRVRSLLGWVPSAVDPGPVRRP